MKNFGENSTVTVDDDAGAVRIATDAAVHRVVIESEGTMGAIDVGNFVSIMGRRTDHDQIEAYLILVEPTGECVRGLVVEVVENMVKLENFWDELLVITTEATQILINGEPGSVTDVIAGMVIIAYGDKQEDGSFVATVLLTKVRAG